MTPQQKDLLLHFMPAWSRRLALSNQLGPEHVTALAPDIHVQPLEHCGALSLDAMYVAAADAPRNPRSAVPLFAKLDGGGVAILETRAGRSIKRALSEIATGNGLILIFFGAPESVRIDPAPGKAKRGSRNTRIKSAGRAAGSYIAVFQKPLIAGRDTERKRVTIALPASHLSQPAVRLRILAWRDFILNSGLAATGELLLVTDLPETAPDLQEFVKSDLRDLRRVDALTVTHHYRRFGLARALQTAAIFARGDYVFWENLASDEETGRNENAFADSGSGYLMECQDVFACLSALWALEDRRGGMPPYGSCTIVPEPIRSHPGSGRIESLSRKNTPPRAALWNKSATRAISLAPPARISKRLLYKSNSPVLGGSLARCKVRAIAAPIVNDGENIRQISGPVES